MRESLTRLGANLKIRRRGREYNGLCRYLWDKLRLGVNLKIRWRSRENNRLCRNLLEKLRGWRWWRLENLRRWLRLHWRLNRLRWWSGREETGSSRPQSKHFMIMCRT